MSQGCFKNTVEKHIWCSFCITHEVIKEVRSNSLHRATMILSIEVEQVLGFSGFKFTADLAM
jgi:hypothetical protein